MQQVFEIAGMHCNGCVNRVTRALKTLAPQVTVTLDPPRAIFTTAQPLSLQAVQEALAQAGDYQVRAL